jgi:hypothetical protein
MKTTTEKSNGVGAWWNDLDYGERMSVLEHVWGRQLGQAAVASAAYEHLYGAAKRAVDGAYKHLWIPTLPEVR